MEAWSAPHFLYIMRSGEEKPPEEEERYKYMALSRKMLKGMGISEEQADTIIEAHAETVDGLKEQLKAAQGKADQLDGVQKELDALRAKSGDDWKDKYNKEHTAFEQYKSEQTAKETKAAKEKAVREYVSEKDFSGKKIAGENLEIAMMALAGMIDGIELDGEKIKDAAALDSVIDSKLSRLAAETKTRGAAPATPPAGNGSGKKTKDEIMSIKDAAQRQAAMLENHELFGF